VSTARNGDVCQSSGDWIVLRRCARFQDWPASNFQGDRRIRRQAECASSGPIDLPAVSNRSRYSFTEADGAEAVARGAGVGLDVRLRICAPATFARMHLVPTLGAFLDTHPKLNLELVMEDRTIDLVAENIDVALCWGPLTGSMWARKLTQAERLVVASPTYLARRGVPNAPADLVEHDAIVYGQSSGGEEWRFRRGTSEISVRIQRRLTVSAAEGVRAAVIDEWTLQPIALWVIFPSSRLTSAKARTFVKWFESTVSGSPLIRPAATDSQPLRSGRTITPLSKQLEVLKGTTRCKRVKFSSC
jgi:LysR substrate binding domain